ncbi:hypothetical protein FRB94_004570 [Tulasnella sp. JGI-2019a]|nr:hypothetical protein FRB93_005604 [Tulasnella sp. JGI-2019a]KAG9001691.1 hypothetical protein FRB94_004570 [Tulasnella sp. JGI-2019a]KAG9030259.1 hypothetical protein FRB95_004195 [Tulasnella sp. JGI-2019a]
MDSMSKLGGALPPPHTPKRPAYLAPSTLKAPSSEPPSPAWNAFTFPSSPKVDLSAKVKKDLSVAIPKTSRNTLPRSLRRPANCISRVRRSDASILEDPFPERRPFVEDFFKNDYLHAATRRQMYCGAVKTRIVAPREVLNAPELPTSVAVDLVGLPSYAIPPTHVLVLYSDRPNTPRHYSAIHALTLLAHCQDIPNVITEPRKTPITALPVISLKVPSPPTFPIILDFFYSLHTPSMAAQFLPIDTEAFRTLAGPDFNGTPEATACVLAQMMTARSLVDSARRVHAIYENAAALGIWHEGFWSALSTAWTVIMDTRALLRGEIPG